MFFFKPTPPTDIYTLSLHDALPISREIWRNTGTVGSSRKPRGRRSPHAHEAGDDRGGVRRRETNVCRRVRVLGEGARGAQVAAGGPEEGDRALRGPGLSHPETRALEVHESRDPAPPALQARDPRPSGWRRLREPRAVQVRGPEDEPTRFRERSLCAASLLLAVPPGRRSRRIARGDAPVRAGDPSEAPHAVRPIRGRPVRRLEHRV